MSLQSQLNKWSNNHHPKWLVVLRVGLGLCLFIKGIQFIQNTTLISQIISGSSFQKFIWLQTVIPWIHLLGAVFIIIGLFTRIAILFQIPILIGAIFFVHSRKGIFAGETDLLFSIVIFILLIVFLVEGGGPFSWDHSLHKEKRNAAV